VVEADSINKFKSRLDKYWTNQDIVYNYDCDLTGLEPVVYKGPTNYRNPRNPPYKYEIHQYRKC